MTRHHTTPPSPAEQAIIHGDAQLLLQPLQESAMPQTGGPDTYIAPTSWVDYVRNQHAPLLGAIAADAARLAGRNREAGYGVIVSTEDPSFVSQSLARILDECYGGTFPIKQFTDPDFIKSQIDADMITSFVLADTESGRPVGTSSLRHTNKEEWEEAYRSGKPIGIELARSASIPSKAATTELMQARQKYLFENDQLLGSHAFVFVDSRASVARTLPNGENLKGGAATQHSTLKNGLTPTFLHASYDFKGLFEPMLRYQMTFDKEGQQTYLREHPIYLPANAKGLLGFTSDTLRLAGLEAEIRVGRGNQHSSAKLDIENNGVYSEGHLVTERGVYSPEAAARVVEDPQQPDALLVKIPSTEDNLAVMNQLVDAGFIATGVMPGTSTQLSSPDGMMMPYSHPTYVIFVKNRKGILADAPDLEVPQELESHPVSRSAKHLWDIMRKENA